MLKCAFPVDTEVIFPVADGGELRFARGDVPCVVQLERVIQATDDELSDEVEAWQEVSDATGCRFRLTRRVPGHEFLPLISLGQPEIQLDEVDHELRQIRCRFHSRQFLPAVGRVSLGDVRPFSYFTKDLRLTIDLLVTRSKYGGDRLIIRAPETEYRGIGGEPTPPVLVQTKLTALLLLWPSMFALEYRTERPERLE